MKKETINLNLLVRLKDAILNLTDIKSEDGTKLYVDGELEVGKDIMAYADDNEPTPAPDGEYKVDDKIIVAEGGRIKEIRLAETEKEPEQEPTPEPEQMHAYKAVSEAFSASYEERTRRIAEAIIAMGFDSYGWLVEAGDDFAVWHVWSETDGEKFIRFEVSWNGEEAVVSNPTEVRPSFVPVNEPEPAAVVVEEELNQTVATLQTENDELKAKLAEAEQKLSMSIDPKPAGEPEQKTAKNSFLADIHKRQ